MDLWRLSAGELLDRLAGGEITSVEATRACIARAEDVDGRINALPVRRFEAALEEAAAADATRARGEAGPLCGLPITIKENIDLEGFDSTMSLEARKGRPAARDAVIPALLRQAGAVVLGKTNVPQLLLAQETESSIYGVTNNPWNLERVPGGSSGGEAAAVASGISPLGIGTDIGGSIRIPCHFTGVAGLKPTLDRWSNRGSQGASPGQEVVRSQMGPLARRVGDLRRLYDAVGIPEMARVDPRVPPLPIGPNPDLKGLRVGVYEDDGFLTPSGSVVRAVRRAAEVLDAAGATLVPIAPPDQGEVIYLWLAAISSDGGRTIEAKLAGEDVSPQLKPSRRLLGLPGPARAALAAVMDRLGERRVSRLLRVLGEKPVKALWDLAERRTALRMEELDLWNKVELDAVLCPPHSVPAMGHRESADFVLSCSYPFRYSLLNFPAGVVPVTRVNRADAAAARDVGDRVEKKRGQIERAGVGLPVGAQLVARPYHEEVVLALMEAVEAGVRGDDDYPITPVSP